jgi:acetyl esterase/lipase
MMNNDKYEVDVQDAEYQSLAGKPWLARIYKPKGKGPFPTIIDVHGGAWHNGDRTNNAGIDEALAASGILVAALDFRQPPEAGYPASVCDVNLAVRWLKAHAAEFNGTTTVGAFGNSSGGHQVVLAALRPRHASYTALPLVNHPENDASLAYVIAGWPVIDPLYRFNYAKRINNQEHVNAHIEYWRTEEAMAEGSPQTILDQGEPVEMPPILMLLKANDRNHPLEMQERFIASYRKRGGSIEVHSFEGLPEHRMVPSPSQPETMRAMEIMTAFIQRQAAGDFVGSRAAQSAP